MTASIFLLPDGTFFIELVTMVVILLLMTKYILPPLNKALESRQEKIRESLAAADAARAEAAAAGDERAKLLNAARDQAREIVAAAQATSDQVRAEAAGRGQAEYDRIIANANAEVDTARQRAIDEASARIGEVVFELVNQIVGREVDESSHQDLVREAVAALNVEAARGIHELIMLPKLEGYAAARLGSLDAAALATVVGELASLEQTVLSRADLRAVLTDTSITGVSRGLIVHDLLAGKVHDVTLQVASYAASNAAAQDVPHALGELAYGARELSQTGAFPLAGLGLMASRQRVSGFADALLDDVDAQNFDEIEDELFRWARTIEGNLELRRLLLDRDADLESRLGTVEALLGGKVDAVTLALARFVVSGGRARDVVGTLDFLVDYVAKARDWRVARVHTARPLDAQSQTDLIASLTALTGKNVELQVADAPELLGGVLVEIGDLRLDATTRARLGALREAVSPGHLYESSLNRND